MRLFYERNAFYPLNKRHLRNFLDNRAHLSLTHTFRTAEKPREPWKCKTVNYFLPFLLRLILYSMYSMDYRQQL
jgi:hypothetical protein